MSSVPTDLPLPIIDLANLSSPNQSNTDVNHLSGQLSTAFSISDAFSTTGFAYLVNAPISLTHSEIFTLARDLFALPHESKMKVAKKTFQPENINTYRGYFPAQTGSDNLKEGFEIGSPTPLPQSLDPRAKFNLGEPNIWPPGFDAKSKLETLYQELQSLSEKLLSLLALALGKDASFFAHYLHNSISTLRLLHYPAITPPTPHQQFCCTPHTDSGLLTLLCQDATGGLEVLRADGAWIPAPYVPGSLVVNVGDLMSRVSSTSGGKAKFQATRHRVRSSPGKERYSVPFFFEPGAACLVKSVEGADQGVLYGKHVLEKMSRWVEFQDGGRKGEQVVGSVGEVVAVGA